VPYFAGLATEIINTTPRLKDGEVPLSLFANSNNAPRLDTLNAFECPVFVLETALQQGNKYEMRK